MHESLELLNLAQETAAFSVLESDSPEKEKLLELQEITTRPLGTVGVCFDRRGNVRYLSGGPLGLAVNVEGSTALEKAQHFLYRRSKNSE